MTAPVVLSTVPVSPLTDHEFQLYQEWIHREAGIFLGPHKKAMLVARLGPRLRQLGLSSFQDYYLLVTRDATGGEQVRMLDCICTNETRFFREAGQFEFLERQVFQTWEREAATGSRPKRIRAWSAACSTGEEPYSVAMSLLWHFPAAAGWRLDILGSDLSTRALEQARHGVWLLDKAETIPARYLERFMLKGVRSQAGRMAVGSEIRSLVRFQRINLHRGPYPQAGAFDLVLCRNALIYFSPDTRRQVVQRLVECLAPGGLLLLGHAESLTGLGLEVKSVVPTVYARTADRRREEKP